MNRLLALPDITLAIFAATGFFVIVVLIICGVIAIMTCCWEWFLKQITCPECKRRARRLRNDIACPEHDQDPYSEIRAKY